MRLSEGRKGQRHNGTDCQSSERVPHWKNASDSLAVILAEKTTRLHESHVTYE